MNSPKRPSRRSVIIDLLSHDRTQEEILKFLDEKFPPGTFNTTNKSALAGTQWDIGRKVAPKAATVWPAGPAAEPQSVLERNALVEQLRGFNPTPIIERYRQRDLQGKSAGLILNFSVDKTILRAFHRESPSARYVRWRWHADPERLVDMLAAISDQAAFDALALDIGESLVADWGPFKDTGEPSGMSIGVAMKITNLVLKHLVFSGLCHNSGLERWLHVPWDSFTLDPLRNIWGGEPRIPRKPGQGFVKNLATYQSLHNLITEIAGEAGQPRIIYEFWAWDAAH